MTNIDTATARAQQLLDNRLDLIRQLADARGTVERIDETLAEARKRDADAYKAAKDGGWTDEELRKMDLPQLDAPRRRTRARAGNPAKQ